MRRSIAAKVEDASALLLALAARLEATEEPCPRSAALASFLVHDPLSPASLLFYEGSRGGRATTAELARAAVEEIDHRPLR
jgi:hypothetical protein